MRKLKLIPCALLVGAIVSGLALGCGDKLMLITGGARARQVFGNQAASILAYTRPDTPVARVIRDVESQPVTKRTGLKFSLVADEARLLEALTAAKFDLLIGDLKDVDALQQHLRSAPHPPILLPVIYQATKEEAKTAQKKFHSVLKAPESPRHYLEVIDSALGLRVKDGGTN